jgi:hypothetical protein
MFKTIKLMTTQHKLITSQGIRTGAFLCLLLIGLNGCLTRPALRRETFAFQSPADTKTSSGGTVVAVSFATVSPLFDKSSFTYRTGPQSYESDPYAGFMVAPGEAIAIAMRAHLLDSGRFADVAEPGSFMQGNEFIEAYVSELYGDFREPSHPVAVLSMRISVYNSRNNNHEPILQKDYQERIPLQKNTAADVMTGWNTALGQIMTQFISDLPAQSQ